MHGYPSIDATTWVNPKTPLADQSAAMQLAVNAAAGKRLILPDSDVRFKSVILPPQGVKFIGVRAPFSETGLGTRLILPNNSNSPLFISESYQNNRDYVNYGVSMHGVLMDGNKANQTVAAPLVILRTSRSYFDPETNISNSKGIGLLISATSANGTALGAPNGMPENRISCRFDQCNEEAIYGRDGGTNKLSDVFIDGVIVNACGVGNGTPKYAIEFERGAGVRLERAQVYGNGRGSLRVTNAGLLKVLGNDFEATGMQAVGGQILDVDISVDGYGSVRYNNNNHWSGRANNGGNNCQFVRFTGVTPSTRVSHVGNGYHSENFDYNSAWGYTGHASGQVKDSGTGAYRAPEPASSANIIRQ